MYDRKIFTRRWIRKVLRFYTFFFLRKSVLNVFGKYVAYLASCLDLNFNVKVYVLNNNSVGAVFISKFIAIGLRSKFDYLDMIIPIRKNLRKQMYIRKWGTQNTDYPQSKEYKRRITNLVASVMSMRDLFYFRMQVINNYLRFRWKYSFKLKYSYFNLKLYKFLKFNNNSKKQELNQILFINKKFKFHKLEYIKRFIKTLSNLSKFDFRVLSIYLLKIIGIDLINKGIPFIFYKAIWFRVFLFLFFKKCLNKKMFFYYCSFFSLKKEINNSFNFKITNLMKFILWFKSVIKLRQKSVLKLKYNNYFVIKNKNSFILKFFKKYFLFYIKKLRKRMLKKKK